MSSLSRALARLVVCASVASVCTLFLRADSILPRGGEYRVIGSLPGDQVFPRVALNASGGYIVWQDNATDGDGLGISARKLDGSLSGTLSTFRVNENGAGDQLNPRVALLNNGGAVFTWQGGGPNPRIYARFLTPAGTFATGDVLVNTYSQGNQIDPAVTCLTDGTVVIVWSSYGQDGSLYGVYAQRFTSAGGKLGGEFQVNQTTLNNQRTPTVASLANGNCLVVWISEKVRTSIRTTDPSGVDTDGTGTSSVYDVDAMGRIFDGQGSPVGAEFKIDTSATVCANPSVSVNSDGSLIVAWSGRPSGIVFAGAPTTDGWDVYARVLEGSGTPRGDEFRVNTHTFGDQYRPVVTTLGGRYMVVWSSLGQDGSREGVYGRVMSGDGTPASDEFRVNTTTASQQIYPDVASNGGDQILTVWSSFVGGLASFDLFAQRFSPAMTLVAPAAPFVSALSQTKLSVTWPEMQGYTVAGYDVYVDGATTPIPIQGTIWTATGLVPGSTHSFRIDYRLADGSRSPLSGSESGTTWGEDNNFDGLPDDWQAKYWGANPASWPAANVDSDGDGASNLQEFLAGTDPTDKNNVLRTTIISTLQGYRLSWNTQPGMIYSVQVSEDFNVWTDAAASRFAVGTVDSVAIGANSRISLYRVIRLR